MPDGIAAVIAVIFLFLAAKSINALLKTAVYVGTMLLEAIGSPVNTSNLPIPWNLDGLFSAGK